ncbi:MAG: copper resistance protein CopC/CopD [Chloroflexi bacterium]|nr:copper resistance protein CopC/CopD [Chloroflexota bacterium]
MIRRALAVLLLALAVAGLRAGAADAHANYIRSNPAADARLVRPPTEVRISFSESPDAKGSEIAVFDESGKHYETGTLHPSGDENGLAIAVGSLGDGGYTVAWTALSAIDGHTTKGNFVFAVGNAPLPRIPDVGDGSTAPAPAEVIGRALSFGGIALVLGVASFGVFITRPRDERARAAERQLRVAGGVALLLGSELIFAESATVPARLGALLLLRALSGGVVLALLRVPERLLGDGPKREITVAAGLLAALSATLVSHAAASGDVKQLVLDLAHVLAISVWAGGIAALFWTVVRDATVRDARESRELGGIVWRFSLTALVAVAVVVTTGTLQSLDRLVLIQDLVETPYGVALLAKIVLLLLTLALGALNLVVWGPRLQRALAPERARRALARSVMAEAALLSLVLVASGVLTALYPPAQANAAAYDSTQHVEGLRLELLLATTAPGRNRYVLRVHEGLRPVVGTQKVAFRFTMIEHDMGENELVAEERAPGEYVAQGSATAMYGTWRIQTIVRLVGRDDIRAVFTVPITAQQGASTAKAIVAGPYTLLLFLDPSQPTAGAPFTINLVLIDSKGDPVPTKSPRVTLQGPAAAAPVDGSESTPGRYTFAVAGLDAGSWQATVSVGPEAQAVYGLDVAR